MTGDTTLRDVMEDGVICRPLTPRQKGTALRFDSFGKRILPSKIESIGVRGECIHSKLGNGTDALVTAPSHLSFTAEPLEAKSVPLHPPRR